MERRERELIVGGGDGKNATNKGVNAKERDITCGGLSLSLFIVMQRNEAGRSSAGNRDISVMPNTPLAAKPHDERRIPERPR